MRFLRMDVPPLYSIFWREEKNNEDTILVARLIFITRRYVAG
jgi:hypothetical protein